MPKKTIEYYKYPLVTAIAFAVVGFYALVTFNLSFMGPVARALKSIQMADIYYQISQGTSEPDSSHLVTLVDMTEIIQRGELAEALEDIMAYNPKAVGVDMIFQGLKPDSLGDEMIRTVASSYDNITFSYELMDFDASTQKYQDVRRSFFATSTQEPLQGFTNMPRRDLYDDMKRVVPVGRNLNGEVVPSFITQVVNTYTGEETLKLSEENVNINFHPMSFPTIDAKEVVNHPELIEDRVVLFGAMKDAVDRHYTPLGKIPGVELLAYSVQTLVDQKQIRNLPQWLTWIISFLIPMFTHWWTQGWINYQKRKRKNAFARVFMTSLMVIGFLRFVWMALLTGIGYLLFNFYDLSINFGWAFSAICFLNTGQGFYDVLVAKKE